jgi:hypothetical protein
MPLWQATFLLNLALAVGVGLGYAAWGRRLPSLEREVNILQENVDRLERQRAACAAGACTGEQRWMGHGVVRAVYPQLVLISHEEIAGLMPARTTGFRPSVTAKHDVAHVGDSVVFWLHGNGTDTLYLVEMRPW